MNCFSNFYSNKGFPLVTSDSIKIDLNEIYFKINGDEYAPLYCRVSLHTDPDYVRITIDNDENALKQSCSLDSKIYESLDVTKNLEYILFHNSKIRIQIHLEPLKITVFKGDLLMCSCKIQRDKINKQQIIFVTEMNKITDLYGLAERASVSKLKHGKKYRLFNTDEFGLAQGTDRPLYGSVPFLVAVSCDHCIGVLSRNVSDTYVRLSRQRLRKLCRQYWWHETGAVDIICLAEVDGLQMHRSLLRLTGTTPMPPLFALGYHQCRWNYNNQDDVIKVDSGLRDAGIPCDVLWLDIEHTDGKRYFTWDKEKFDPLALINYLREKGRHLVVIIDPHLKEDPEYDIFRDAQKGGHLVKSEDGTTFIGECWPGNSAWVDYISVAASEWWAEKITAYLKEFGCTMERNYLWIWNDMNEPSVFQSPDNQMRPTALHVDGEQHRTIHNIYGQCMAMATWKGILIASESNLRPFLLSRSFFTGSQKYGAIWTGDTICSWDHLRISVSMVLSLSICGIDFSGADVGGFFGDPEPELLCRWYQLGAMQPFFRAHAHIDSKRREPYLIAEPFKTAIKDAVCLRYKLLAYWYLCFWQTETEHLPIVSSVWTIFPRYNKLDNDTAFMIGSSVLVRPIVSAQCRSIAIIMPGSKQDIWYHYSNISNRWLTSHGGDTVKMPVNIDSMPIFYRGGNCMFLKEAKCSNTEEWQNASYQIIFFPDTNGSSSGLLYQDDGRSYAYKTMNEYDLHKSTFQCKDRTIILETLHCSDETCPGHWSRIVDKVTIVKRKSLAMDECHSVSIHHDNTHTEDNVLQQFVDKIEITNIKVSINGNWTMTIH